MRFLVVHVFLCWNDICCFLFIYFFLDKKVTKNQDSLLFFLISTFYFTNESRPQALWILPFHRNWIFTKNKIGRFRLWLVLCFLFSFISCFDYEIASFLAMTFVFYFLFFIVRLLRFLQWRFIFFTGMEDLSLHKSIIRVWYIWKALIYKSTYLLFL